MNRGVIYIVVGKMRYLKECIFSAVSLKRHCPDIPITLFTDKNDIKEEYFDEIKVIINDINPFKNKVKYMYNSPYDYTLFLDSDTEVRQPIYEMFELLKENDLALAYSPHIDRSHFPARLLGEAEPHPYNTYNTGVILYKKSEKIERVFAKWLEEVMLQDGATMRSGYKSDQYYFNKIVKEKYHLECGIKLTAFSNRIYNARHPRIWHLHRNGEMDAVKILHDHDLHRSFLTRQYIRISERISRDSFNKVIRQLSGNPKS